MLQTLSIYVYRVKQVAVSIIKEKKSLRLFYFILICRTFTDFLCILVCKTKKTNCKSKGKAFDLPSTLFAISYSGSHTLGYTHLRKPDRLLYKLISDTFICKNNSMKLWIQKKRKTIYICCYLYRLDGLLLGSLQTRA